MWCRPGCLSSGVSPVASWNSARSWCCSPTLRNAAPHSWLLVGHLQPQHARVELPGLLHVADLQDHVAELASLDHASAPRAVAAPRRSRRMPYTLSPDASIDARGGQVMGIAESGALRGKVAIITGAATGIGRASALLFAQAGAPGGAGRRARAGAGADRGRRARGRRRGGVDHRRSHPPGGLRRGGDGDRPGLRAAWTCC